MVSLPHPDAFPLPNGLVCKQQPISCACSFGPLPVFLFMLQHCHFVIAVWIPHCPLGPTQAFYNLLDQSWPLLATASNHLIHSFTAAA